MPITSHDNQKLKEIRKLRQRRRERDRTARFVAEGEDLLAAADAAGWTPVERFCVAGSGLPGTEVEAKLLASASELGSGTRTLAVFEERWAPAPTGPLAVYLHGVGDPGNVGAVLRSAQAFGASCVILGPGSADPFGPKAVRGSMGAIFGVPLVRVGTGGSLPGMTIALDAAGEQTLAELWRELTSTAVPRTAATPPAPAVTLLIGAERDGLPQDLLRRADKIARIPIETHSLNAAMAATVALYEVTRMAPA
jgi:RNA methyltransferase, TrmH family